MVILIFPMWIKDIPSKTVQFPGMFNYLRLCSLFYMEKKAHQEAGTNWVWLEIGVSRYPPNWPIQSGAWCLITGFWRTHAYPIFRQANYLLASLIYDFFSHESLFVQGHAGGERRKFYWGIWCQMRFPHRELAVWSCLVNSFGGSPLM